MASLFSPPTVACRPGHAEPFAPKRCRHSAKRPFRPHACRAGSLGPSTWLPWLYAMVACIVVFAANGLYQVRWGHVHRAYKSITPPYHCTMAPNGRTRLGSSNKARPTADALSTVNAPSPTTIPSTKYKLKLLNSNPHTIEPHVVAQRRQGTDVRRRGRPHARAQHAVGPPRARPLVPGGGRARRWGCGAFSQSQGRRRRVGAWAGRGLGDAHCSLQQHPVRSPCGATRINHSACRAAPCS